MANSTCNGYLIDTLGPLKSVNPKDRPYQATVYTVPQDPDGNYREVHCADGQTFEEAHDAAEAWAFAQPKGGVG